MDSTLLRHAARRHPARWRLLSAAAAGLLSLAGGLACAAEPKDVEAGRTLFMQATTPACAVCHTLADAGAAGTIGPSLDELKPDANRVAQAVRNGIGVMPAFDALSDADVQALAKYVSGVTGGAQ
ncbi:c-type cytochrome [Achromobacter deleyi]|uniref:SorU family sulfite dehydrogenase c-type cytochrome subunit n=1 Tax=Achromobacter deleyi TaxID=1353891 RepID=UPI001490A65B|nr:cytochrome c [Achromobacter deleyi]QVQ26978.1 cytochrome c [Achromobacter deleyi]UIP22555.1 cytochrome c [Achromobacter deleyi]